MSEIPEQQPSHPQPESTDLVPVGQEVLAVPEFMPYQDYDGMGTLHAQPHGRGGTASIVTMLLRRKWLILFVSILVGGAAIPCVWMFFTPSYKATAVVRISPVLESIVFPQEKGDGGRYFLGFVNTEVSVIRSSTVLERVLDQSELRDTQWYKEMNKQLASEANELMERMQQTLEVLPRKGTELVDVTFTASSAADAKTIANLVVAQYKRVKDEMERTTKTQLFETLTNEQASLQMEIDGLLKTKYNIARRFNTDKMDELRHEMSRRFSEMEAQMNGRQRDLDITKWMLKTMASAQTQPAGSIIHQYVQDGEWLRLTKAVEDANNAVELTRQKYGERHPEMKVELTKVEFAKKSVREREAQLQNLWHASAATTAPAEKGKAHGSGLVATPPSKEGIKGVSESKGTARLEQNVAAATTQPVTGVAQSRHELEFEVDKKQYDIELLRNDLEKQRAKLVEAGEIAQEISNYDEKIKQKRDLYEHVRLRRERLEMEEKAPGRVRVAAYAVDPAKPFNDRRVLFSIGVAVLALGVGMGVGYLRSVVDKRIYEPKEVQNIYQAPFLGLLPMLPPTHIPRELGGPFIQSISETVVNPRLLLMENMRMIRTTLLERVAQTGQRVVLITSSLPHTGKTSVAVLLAQSLAVVGKRVLLVEADLRRPVLGERLRIESKLGLAALLTGRATNDEVVIRADIARFDLVPAGDLPENFDPELMANGVFTNCIRRWRETYDFVLLDSPPILHVADAQILASSADGTIMVIRSSHDRRMEAMQAFAQLSAAGGTLLGTVLIGGQFGPRDSWRDGYGYGYGYGYEGKGDRFVEQQKKQAVAEATKTNGDTI